MNEEQVQLMKDAKDANSGVRWGAARNPATPAGESIYKTDYFKILERARPEVPDLINTLNEGRVDGNTYYGPYCDVIGTLAKARGCEVHNIATPNSSRPIEQMFSNIRPGHTPKNSAYVRLAVKWAEEFLALTKESGR